MIMKPISLCVVVTALLLGMIAPAQSQADVFTISTDTSWRVADVQPAEGWNTSLDFKETGFSQAIKNRDQDVNGFTADGLWHASGQPNVWFRKTFGLTELPSSAILDLVVDDEAELYINGKRVVNDQDGTSSYIYNVDVTSALRVGKNLLAVRCKDLFCCYQTLAIRLKITAQRFFDCDEDGKPDILWQNQISGDLGCWLMDGTKRLRYTSIAPGIPLAWKVVGTPDLNGDGRPDILWQNDQTGEIAYWLMKGTQRIGSGTIATGVSRDWKVAGTPDLDGDGDPDILWHNRLTGDVAYWIMEGTRRLRYGVLTTHVPIAWRIAGTPDLNGDGKADLLWQNTVNGDVAYWLLNGINHIGTGTIAKGVPRQWTLAGRSDLNGDGKADLLWQNTETGDVAYWLLTGASRTGSGTIYQGVPREWRIVGMH